MSETTDITARRASLADLVRRGIRLNRKLRIVLDPLDEVPPSRTLALLSDEPDYEFDDTP